MSKSFSFCAVCFFCSLSCNVFAQSAAYNYCIKDAAKVSDEAMAECMKAENSRLNKQIYSEYEKISKDSSFTNWNQGSGMFRGRLKNLYENWTNFKNEYCDLYVLSMTNYTGSPSYNRESCLMDMNLRQLIYISSVLRNYNSTPE